MSDNNPSAANREPRIKHFPVAFFAMIMGLIGLSIAWDRAQATFGMAFDMGGALRWFGLGLFGLILVMYLAKLVLFSEAVVKEWQHPIQLNFFPTISISMILLGIALLPSLPGVAAVFWMLGSALHLLLTLYVVSIWIHHDRFEIHHINPAWFIPIVGNALVPIAGVPLGYTELSWFFFSIAMLFWLILFTIIIYRMLFHQPLPDRLMPTFFILIAPPAVGFIAYIELAGLAGGQGLDGFARVLYYSSLFLTLLLLTQVGRFVRLHYFISWWAYSFPLAAVTIATLIMFEITGLLAFAIIGWTLLSLVTLVVIFLLYRTAVAVGSRSICVPHL
ncbi:MAG: C4-dicarboxylate ABC transporter [Gammaproteobacteria bacterium]|jgi:tellurite resistance protein|nr:C4-dicarboxylate ABC transporter [Gammaproteobacteria bacterium]